ncbi:hypothetical protein ACH42_14045 [Endozoicomonas sp. (ex Bugula neritina AB1)]|nr:hypothetical protein ACH42_14045 [Endozoicomonas sp. (ex Bugula neritina AB1)]
MPYRIDTLNTRMQYALFLKQLQHLKPWQLTTIATSITERSWPNYTLFAELTEFGELADVRHCLNMLWDNAAGLQHSKNFERLLERLDLNTPDLNDFDMIGAQLALDVIVSMNCAIHCAMEASDSEVASIMTLSLSTIGKFVKYSEAPELKGTELTQYIEQHELYTVQMDFIEELIRAVSLKNKQDKDFVRSLQKLATNNGVSQLGISLE